MTSPLSLSDSGLTRTAEPNDEKGTPLHPLCVVWTHPQSRIDELVGSKHLLGRSSECSLRLKGSLVSRCHASLKQQRTGWLLSDLGSKNGIQVNGLTVQEEPLSEQDVIRVGEWVGILCRQTRHQIQNQSPMNNWGGGLHGSLAIGEAYRLLVDVAKSNLNVMLVGETGSGKEVFARLLHQLSERPGKLISTNCATIAPSVAEGELFGYRRGAFTGAERSNIGHFRNAHRGTLFLDEIPDLDEGVQIKLLRALEEKAVVPLGQSHPEAADARVVCAGQLALHEYVEEGRFRADLYSRLNGVELTLPPLRQRREEIMEHFRRLLARDTIRLTPDLVEQLCLYDWPMNIRELVQLVDRTKVLHGAEEELRLTHLPARIATYSSKGCTVDPLLPPTPQEAKNAIPDAEKLAPRDALATQFAQSLEENRGNVSLAAKKVGISRPMAYRLMKRMPDLEPEEIRLKGYRS